MNQPASMRVAVLSVTPVKSLGVHHPEHVDLVAGGVDGDRAFFLIDDAGKMVNCTAVGDLLRYRAEFDANAGVLEVHGPDGLLRSAGLEDGEAVVTDFYGLRSVSGRVMLGWDQFFSEIAGFPLRLVRGDTGGFDVAGVTVIGSPSVRDLAERSAADPVDSRRFRMNIEIAGGQSLAEDTWEGREVQVGAALVRIGGPVKRCAATTRDPDTGVIDLKTLEMIGTLKGRQETPQWGAGFYLGVYADVVVPGRVSLGDEVFVL